MDEVFNVHAGYWIDDVFNHFHSQIEYYKFWNEIVSLCSVRNPQYDLFDVEAPTIPAQNNNVWLANPETML